MVLTDEATSRQLSTLYDPAIDAGLGFMLSWKGEAEGFPSEFFTDVDAASAFTAKRAADRADVWTSVAIYREAPPPGQRGKADTAAGLVGFFADLDVKPKAFASKDEARRFIYSAFYNVPPSMIVDSGTGLHAWFLFVEPWVFADENDREKAKALAKRFVDSVRAAAGGRELDAVGDLARVLRVAGTVNYSRGNGKDGVERPTLIVFPDADAPIRRYSPDDLEAVMVDPAFVPATDASAPAPEVGYLTLAPDRPEPEVVGVLRSNDERFLATWERRRDLKDSSPSGYCMAIADALAVHNATDQEIADAMIAWRRAHGADLKLRQDWYQRTIAAARRFAASRRRPDPGPLPRIVVKDGRHLRQHSEDAIAAIRRANEPEPSVFARGGALARVKTTDEGRIVIESLALDALRGVMERSASFVRPSKGDDYRAEVPPMDIVRDIQSLPEWPGIPALVGIVTSPRIRPDGTVLSRPGYDPATRLFLTPTGETIEVPAAPTGEDARRAAAAIIDGPLADFPFVSDADKANAIGFALSIVARPAIAGSVPVAIFDARSGQGTGKSLLVRTLHMIACGTESSMNAIPGDEEEWRKSLLPLLMRGGDVVVFDNATRPVESGTFANVVTSAVFEDRILGASRRVELPVRCCWAVTGNRVTLGGDMARRCFPVELDARVERPEDRENFRHPDLIAWVRANRSAMLRALLIMARAWWVAGCPAPSVKPWGNFEEYVRVVGGILEHSGVTGFLANRQEFRETADDERAEWALFLSILHASFGEKSFTAREVFDRVGAGEVGAIPVGSLPGDLAENFNRAGTPRRIGMALAKWAGRVVGGITLDAAMMDKHTKVRTFRTTKGGVR